MRQNVFKTKWAVSGIVLGILLIIAAAALYTVGSLAEDSISWQLTLVGKNNEQRVLSYDEIRSMPYEEAQGGFFTTVGVINGPYEVKGVLLTDLCALVGGVTSSDIVSASAADGYAMVFDYDQIGGDMDTYDPVDIHVVPHEKLMILLIYEQDGKPLSDSDGRPLRIAIAGSEALLTEGHNWVKWVNKIEVIPISAPESTPGAGS
jgi:DMSO/TMAO reductase YedYZ molybdopterin-dependent catalytic subunit